MAYVPNYECDIFVSYAHADNQPPAQVQTGWVTCLVETLRSEVDRHLKNPERKTVEIWWDHSHLDEAKPFPDQIRSTVSKTAIQLVVLSQAYMNSDWCKSERELFLDHAGENSLQAGQIFLVDVGTLEIRDRPPEFADLLGFQFWEKKSDTGAKRQLGYPTPNPAQPDRFFDQCVDLAVEISRRLEELSSQAASPQAHETDSADQGVTVFLAESSDDLELQRTEVAGYLKQFQIHVVPARTLPNSREDCLKMLDPQLQDSVLFAQLLGPYPGGKLAGSDERLTALQFKRAAEMGKEILQWRDPSLDLSKVPFEEYRTLLSGDHVMSRELEVFKQELLRLATRKPESKEEKRPEADGTPFVFVDTSIEDRELAGLLTDKLGELSCMTALPLDSGGPSEIREDFEDNVIDCDGLILLYGQSTLRWLREQLRFLRKLLGKRDEPLRGIAVYDAPPKEKESLSMSFPGLQIIDCREGTCDAPVSQFVQSLKGEAG